MVPLGLRYCEWHKSVGIPGEGVSAQRELKQKGIASFALLSVISVSF